MTAYVGERQVDSVRCGIHGDGVRPSRSNVRLPSASVSFQHLPSELRFGKSASRIASRFLTERAIKIPNVYAVLTGSRLNPP